MKKIETSCNGYGPNDSNLVVFIDVMEDGALTLGYTEMGDLFYPMKDTCKSLTEDKKLVRCDETVIGKLGKLNDTDADGPVYNLEFSPDLNARVTGGCGEYEATFEVQH